MLAALAGRALAALSGLPGGDALRATLLTAPCAAFALVVIERTLLPGAVRRRARARAEAAVLAALLLAGASLSRLGLTTGAPIVAAALVVLLVAHLAGLLPDLRRRLGRRLPAAPPLAFFLLPLVVYAALLPWSTARRPPDGDEPWYLLLAHSLAYDGDADLSNNYRDQHWRAFVSRPLGPQPGDPVGRQGKLYSRHDLLLPLLLAPAYRLGGAAGAMLAMAAATAWLSVLLLQLAARTVPGYPGAALLAWCLFSFAPPLLFYSHQVWVEVPAALLVAIGLRQILDLGVAPVRRLRTWLALLAVVVLLPVLKLRFALLAGSLVVVAAVRLRHARAGGWRLVLASTGGLAAIAALLLLVNSRLYGNALKVHSWRELELYRYPLDTLATHLAGPLFDLAFGLLGCAPLWLLVVPAAVWCWRDTRPLLRDLLLLAGPYLVVASARNEWYGGWSPPFRYAVVFLPLLALVLVPLLGRRRGFGARATATALLLATLALAILFVVVPGFTYNLADGGTHLVDRLETLVGHDLRRFAPSYVRPRAASWLLPPLLAGWLVWSWRPSARAAAGARRERAELAGVAMVLLLLPAMLLLARLLPTRHVEVESPAVEKTGGQREPSQWTFDRLRYAESWVLTEGARVTVPVVPGGQRVRLRLRARTIRNHTAPLRLLLRRGDEASPLATIDLDPPEAWRTIELPETAWPAAARALLLELPPAPGLPQSGVALDRIDFCWR